MDNAYLYHPYDLEIGYHLSTDVAELGAIYHSHVFRKRVSSAALFRDLVTLTMPIVNFIYELWRYSFANLISNIIKTCCRFWRRLQSLYLVDCDGVLL